MSNIKLSIIMPGYKDPYAMQTIKDILKNSQLGDALEIIHVWDGFYPSFEIIQDPHVRYVHLGKNRGMRGAINAGIAVARGKFFMRLDEHCSFAPGFDKILTDDCKENEIMTAKRYFLDPIKWEVMPDEPIEHERLDITNVSDTVRKFHGKRWKDRDEKQKDVLVSETEAQQGSMWIANREFFLKTVGELNTEKFGPLIQDSVEVSFKYWMAGGRVMLNKKTWYAHKHRSFARTHNNGTKENPAQNEKGYAAALQEYEKYYNEVIIPRRKEL
jgi:glycosyltransferase involved in cell wall biosynthesis